MFWRRASSKMVIRPWKSENISMIRYGFKEIPEVMAFGLIGALIVIPMIGYHLNKLRDDAYQQSAHKIYFTVMRPEQMPIEGHKYCTK